MFSRAIHATRRVTRLRFKLLTKINTGSIKKLLHSLLRTVHMWINAHAEEEKIRIAFFKN